jgi:AcrR family transcriptional regulator
MASQDNQGGKKSRGGRPAWVPPNLDVVKALAVQGMSMDGIAAALGISPSTLFKKKRECKDFAEAIRRGAAEGEALATSKLFEALKAGKAWAICFYLKARCGWRENDVSGANVNVNVALDGMSVKAEKQRLDERRKQQRKLIRLLTVDERQTYLDLMSRAAERYKNKDIEEQEEPAEQAAASAPESEVTDAENTG